jgi:hypothetical protein
MHDPMIRRGMMAIGALGVAFSLACAGKDFPEVDSDLRGGLAESFTGAPVAAAGASGSTGAGGGSGAGAGGVASGTGGSAGASAAGGSANAAGGSAGSGMASTGGGASGAAGAGMASAGAAGSGPVNAGPACDGFAVLEANCSSGGCHGAGSNLGNFAESETIARTYIGREGAICAGQGSLIDPDDPAGSVLLLKVSDDPPCGQPMPLGGSLDEEDVACLEDWIGSL